MKGTIMRPKALGKSGTNASTRRELEALEIRLNQARPVTIGFPGAVDFDYSPLSPFFAHHLLNNVGDPTVDGA